MRSTLLLLGATVLVLLPRHAGQVPVPAMSPPLRVDFCNLVIRQASGDLDADGTFRVHAFQD